MIVIEALHRFSTVQHDRAFYIFFLVKNISTRDNEQEKFHSVIAFSISFMGDVSLPFRFSTTLN
jgi:hypothetical protein